MSKVALGRRVALDYGYAVRVNDEPPGTFPVFGSNGVTGYIDSFKVCGPGVIVGRKGSVGEVAYTDENYTPTDTAYFLRILDPGKDDLKFWYYFLPLLGIDKNTHSAVPGLSRELAYLIEVKIPSICSQKKIAAVLSNLDAKIDCNNRINAALEAMAKTLYDYWFVQFEFPDANGRPYKSSGGRMVSNDVLKRAIPAVWKHGTLGDLISLEYGKGLKADNRTGSGYRVIGSNGVVGYHSEFLVAGPGIVVGRKGTVGAITYLHEDFFPIDTTYYVKPVIQIKFFYLKSLLSSLGLEKMNSDSAVPGLNREAALRTKVVISEVDTIQEFELKVSEVFSKMHIIEQENQQLTQLRDWLLPMLMNGQVTVA